MTTDNFTKAARAEAGRRDHRHRYPGARQHCDGAREGAGIKDEGGPLTNSAYPHSIAI